jgi:hypothetical protein
MSTTAETNIQNCNNGKGPSQAERVTKRIRRRRGVCMRCRARKVRCLSSINRLSFQLQSDWTTGDGKSLCNECQVVLSCCYHTVDVDQHFRDLDLNVDTP